MNMSFAPVLGSEHRRRSAKAGRQKDLLDAHYLAFSSALKLELSEESQRMENRMKEVNKKELKRTGLALFDLEVGFKETFLFLKTEASRSISCLSVNQLFDSVQFKLKDHSSETSIIDQLFHSSVQ